MEDNAKVSIAALDSALTHMQETNKRLARLLALSLVVSTLSLIFMFSFIKGRVCFNNDCLYCEEYSLEVTEDGDNPDESE